ncbi:MAG: GNAT family N-acetyltransferase [Bdellovibrio sp.]
MNPGDDLATTFHFGLFVAGKIISIATFIQEPYSEFAAEHPYRLRGMATDPNYSGQGYGQALLRYGVEFLKEQSCDLLWFNARQGAFPFYEKLNFYYHGPLFEMKDIGPHKVMYKTLIPR